MRHLVTRGKAPQRAGEGQQGLRCLGLAPGLDDGGLRVKGRSGEAGVGLQHGTLTRLERVELGAYGDQVSEMAALRCHVGHEDVGRRFALRLPQHPGHGGSFGVVETLGTEETIGAGTRFDVEYELRCLDRACGSGHHPGEHMLQAVTRSQFRHRTLQFGQSGLQKPDLHVRLAWPQLRVLPRRPNERGRSSTHRHRIRTTHG